MICPNCSLPVNDGTNFCPNCGYALGSQAGSPYFGASAAAAAGTGTQGGAATAQNPGWSSASGHGSGSRPSGESQSARKPGQASSSSSRGFWEKAQQTQWSQQPPASGSTGYAPRAEPARPQAQPGSILPSQKSKVVAGVLAIFLGSLGIHKFYLGYTREGAIMLLVTLLTFGVGAFVMEIIAIIEGIMYLVKSDPDFYYTYVLNKRGWF